MVASASAEFSRRQRCSLGAAAASGLREDSRADGVWVGGGFRGGFWGGGFGCGRGWGGKAWGLGGEVWGWGASGRFVVDQRMVYSGKLGVESGNGSRGEGCLAGEYA